MYRAGEKGRKKDVGRLFAVVLSAVLLLMMLMGMVLASAEKVLAVDAKSGEALDQASADSAFGELLSNQITGWPAGIDIAPYAAVLMDMDTGTILYGKDMHVQHYPASITKVMTALLAVENGTADQIVTFSHDAIYNIEPGSANISMKEGEQITLDTALRCMMSASANEVAYAIAETIGGTYDNFIQMMNDRAAELGCTDTHFANPHGLYDAAHYVSAHDMALIAAAAYSNEWFRDFCGLTTYNRPVTAMVNEPWVIYNHHKMFRQDSPYYYEGCTGGKTGYTDEAHNTLVTYAERNGMRLVCIILHGEGTQVYDATRALFNWGFSTFTHRDLAACCTNGSVSSTVNGEMAVIPVEADENAITTVASYEGEKQGYMSVSYNGYEVGAGEVNFTSSYIEEQEKKTGEVNGKTSKKTGERGSGLAKTAVRVKRMLENRLVPWYIYPIVILILAAAVVFFRIRLKKKRNAGRKRKHEKTGKDV